MLLAFTSPEGLDGEEFSAVYRGLRPGKLPGDVPPGAGRGPCPGPV